MGRCTEPGCPVRYASGPDHDCGGHGHDINRGLAATMPPRRAAGSAAPGATTADTMPDDGLSSQLTSVYQSVQNVPVPRVDVGFDDTAVPGQLAEGISGLSAAFTASTGAGQGSGHDVHPNAGGSS